MIQPIPVFRILVVWNMSSAAVMRMSPSVPTINPFTTTSLPNPLAVRVMLPSAKFTMEPLVDTVIDPFCVVTSTLPTPLVTKMPGIAGMLVSEVRPSTPTRLMSTGPTVPMVRLSSSITRKEPFWTKPASVPTRVSIELNCPTPPLSEISIALAPITSRC